MKDMTECRERLRGIFNITVTPFTQNGDIDYAGLAANIERVIGLGYDGILIGGTYGEFPALSPDERVAIFRHVMVVVNDRVPIILCSAGSDAQVVAQLTQLAGDLGGLPGQPFTGTLRREIQMVFQDPYSSLHPKHTLMQTLAESLNLLHERDVIDHMYDRAATMAQGSLSTAAINRCEG
ncbi:4-hydroxy-tetrahydrodipicolinate synthase [Sodalis glossinidius str. 'morsitans']|uniref:4-hydroxy-tetrahydrodipicolinate synthase n=1 Tax=Sodalis glossinidius (strain morsitans) TaxID=343509 RepID=Q2NVD3_SODGM|nr:hypothetical protein SG0617 [Sodalis glossinidius str. 'morsitans']CRL44344.1 4-hydroxy-tetrahydrodipicolinate synthase [Sodalis glossinidius str. 'morsitans']